MLLEKVDKFKGKPGQKIEAAVLQEKNKMLKLGHQAVLKNKRLRILRAILLQLLIRPKLNSNKRVLVNENFVGNIAVNTKNHF